MVVARNTVIESISGYIKRRKKRKTNSKYQVLDLIIPVEREIRSIVGGLETSMGKTLWEPLAKNLASRNGFQICSEDLKAPVNIPANLQLVTTLLIENRITPNFGNTAKYCHDQIKNACRPFTQSPITKFSTAKKRNWCRYFG